MPPGRRLFAAVWPPEELVRGLESLDRPALPGIRWTTRDQWHVTLRFFGTVDEEGEVAAAEATGAAAAACAGSGLTATAGPLPYVLGRTVWVLPVSGLEPLADAIGEVRGAPVQDTDRAFRGHLTLARAKAPAALRALSPSPIGMAWSVGEVTLVASTLHPHGARYEVVRRWPL